MLRYVLEGKSILLCRLSNVFIFHAVFVDICENFVLRHEDLVRILPGDKRTFCETEYDWSRTA